MVESAQLPVCERLETTLPMPMQFGEPGVRDRCRRTATCLLECLEAVAPSLCAPVVAAHRENEASPGPARLTLRSLSTNLLVQVEPADAPDAGSSEIAIGFPFPIERRPLAAIAVDLDVRLTAHGEPVRGFYYQPLLDAIISSGTSWSWHETDLVDRFTQQVRDALAACDTATYHDPFRFIGDSISHLDNLELYSPLLTHIDGPQGPWSAVLTANDSLVGWGPFRKASSGPRAQDAAPRDMTIALVAPVFIDDHWPAVARQFAAARATYRAVVMLVPGRHMLVVADGAGKTTIQRLRRPDANLLLGPVEVMRQEAARLFGARSSSPLADGTPRASAPDACRRAVICPFASTADKSLRAGQLRAVVAACARSEVIDDIVLVGTPGNGTEMDALERAASTVAQAQVRALDLEGLSALQRHAGVVIAADSAATHLALHVGTPVVTIYRTANWDDSSWPSVAHHSPIGFASTSPLQVPLLAGGDDDELKELLRQVLSTRLRGAIAPEAVLRCRQGMRHMAVASDLSTILAAWGRMASALEVDPGCRHLTRSLPLDAFSSALADAPFEVGLRAARFAAGITMAGKVARHVDDWARTHAS